MTTLTLAKGPTTHAFEFAGDYTQSDFSITPGTHDHQIRVTPVVRGLDQGEFACQTERKI